MKSTTKSKPSRLFIDTSAWIAYMVSNEAYHEKVAQCLDYHIKNGSKLITSDYVLDETFTWLITHQNFHSAIQLKQQTSLAVNTQNLLILFTDETIFHKSWAVFKKYADHRLSFTDASIVTYYQDLKLDLIITLDQGFSQIGLHTKP